MQGKQTAKQKKDGIYLARPDGASLAYHDAFDVIGPRKTVLPFLAFSHHLASRYTKIKQQPHVVFA